MPLSLAFNFPAGRYHATPFGHHVNEGMLEWPPSPWRITRSLVSVGYTSGVWSTEGPCNQARSLILKLCDELPCYHLPTAVSAHSRHYMPKGKFNSCKDGEETKLVFDTWCRINRQDTLFVLWQQPILEPAELSILEDLLARLSYLGRSESWVEGRVVGEDEELPAANCFPDTERGIPGGEYEQISLLAAMSFSSYTRWRERQLGRTLAASDPAIPERKQPSRATEKNRKAAKKIYPEDISDCLQKDTNWWRGYGWNRPPGSRSVFYRRPPNAITVGAPSEPARKSAPPPVYAMLLSLTNDSRNDHALPAVLRTLPNAEHLRRKIVGIAERLGRPPIELTGHDENHRHLRGSHEHAHVIPLDLDNDRHLDHVLIWAAMGFSPEAQMAIRRLRKAFLIKGSTEPLRVALAGAGSLKDFLRLPEPYGCNLKSILGCSRNWQSITPFVAPRFRKKRGRNTLEGQIQAELRSRGLPEPKVLELLPREMERLRFRHFKITRQHGPTPPVSFGLAIRMEFDQPVKGPISLGYGSHFGLGLFSHPA